MLFIFDLNILIGILSSAMYFEQNRLAYMEEQTMPVL